MKTTISIEGIEFYAFHGCLDEEARIGGRYQVDVHIQKDLSQSMESDDLMHTVDYVTVNEIVKREMAIRSKLIEHVGGRILQGLENAFPGKKSILLKITKFNPPVHGSVRHTSFTIEENYE